jgi:hypothetical protein
MELKRFILIVMIHWITNESLIMVYTLVLERQILSQIQHVFQSIDLYGKRLKESKVINWVIDILTEILKINFSLIRFTSIK